MIVIWNRGFDRPRVEKSLGVNIPIEATEDSMDAFHVLYNAFRRRLGFASSLLPSCARVPMWKHMNHTHPEFYSCMDAIALLRNHYDAAAKRTETGAEPVWQLLHTRLDPALDHMSRKGMLVNLKMRAAMSVRLGQQLREFTAQFNAIVPPEVRTPKTWVTRDNAEKGRMTLVANAQRDGDPWEDLAAAPLFSVPATKDVTTCGVCGIILADAPGHRTRKFLKETTDGSHSNGTAPDGEHCPRAI